MNGNNIVELMTKNEMRRIVREKFENGLISYDEMVAEYEAIKEGRHE